MRILICLVLTLYSVLAAVTEAEMKELVKIFEKSQKYAPKDTYKDYAKLRKKVRFSYKKVSYPASYNLRGKKINNIAVIADEALYNMLPGKITRYIDDIQKVYGCNVNLYKIDKNLSADGIKKILTNEYSNGLDGAVLVGNLGSRWYEIDNDYGSMGYKEWPCDLYYMDMDGIWTDSDNNGKLDRHTGDIKPEIFIGRINTANMSGMTGETQAATMSRYLIKIISSGPVV